MKYKLLPNIILTLLLCTVMAFTITETNQKDKDNVENINKIATIVGEKYLSGAESKKDTTLLTVGNSFVEDFEKESIVNYTVVGSTATLQEVDSGISGKSLQFNYARSANQPRIAFNNLVIPANNKLTIKLKLKALSTNLPNELRVMLRQSGISDIISSVKLSESQKIDDVYYLRLDVENNDATERLMYLHFKAEGTFEVNCLIDDIKITSITIHKV